jgi:hypothetical protein
MHVYMRELFLILRPAFISIVYSNRVHFEDSRAQNIFIGADEMRNEWSWLWQEGVRLGCNVNIWKQ